jgi:biotin operon repressor
MLLTEQSGNPKELASKLGISERSVYNYISYMKGNDGTDIEQRTKNAQRRDNFLSR